MSQDFSVTTLWLPSQVEDFISSLPEMFMSDYSGEHSDICQAALQAALYSIMGNVEKDFRRKSQRQPGASGDTWRELSDRRIRERLEKTRSSYKDKLGKKLLELREARGDIGYEEGGTLPILIDEGNLVRAMSQGVISGQGAHVNYKPTENQELFPAAHNVLEVDVNVSGAHAHNDGTGRMPQRRIVPDKFPDEWQEQATEVAAEVICEFIVEILQGPPPRNEDD